MYYVYVKVYRTQTYLLVAACDEELLGKTLVEGETRFEVNERFYKGSRVTLEEAINLIKNADTANLIGARIVDRAKREKLVHPEAVLNIAGVPHAQIVKV